MTNIAEFTAEVSNPDIFVCRGQHQPPHLIRKFPDSTGGWPAPPSRFDPGLASPGALGAVVQSLR